MKIPDKKIILLAMGLACSCTKDKHPTINVIKPFNGEIFNSPEEIEIVADIWDSDAVTSKYLVVTKENINNDTVINWADYTLTDGTYHLLKTFTSEPNTKYKIVISAIGHDHLVSDTIRISSD